MVHRWNAHRCTICIGSCVSASSKLAAVLADMHLSIPNLPFFYLVFRAWSHWKALGGSKHLQFLVDNKLVTPTPSKILDELYCSGARPLNISSASLEGTIDRMGVEETMVLHKSDGKRIAEALEIPELNIELDRAVWQIERDLKAKKELKEEKDELDSVNLESNVKK